MRKNKLEIPPFFMWGFHILNKWLQIKNKGCSLKPYFEDNHFSKVAIYGLGAIGERLYEELQLEGVEVTYGIDQNAEYIHIKGLEMKTLEEELSEADVVVVTPIAFYEIEKSLYKKVSEETIIVSIEDIVDYCIGY